MKTKTLAVIGDLIMIGMLVVGTLGLLIGAPPLINIDSDKLLFPLSREASRLTVLLSAAAVVVGLAVAALQPHRRALAGRDVIRYSGLERLVHWTVVLGYLLAAGTAALMLRWLSLTTSPVTRPLVYLLHFVGAALLVFAAVVFATAYRARGADALFPRWSDVSPAIARLFAYLGVYGEPGVLGLRWSPAWQKSWQEVLGDLGIRPREREEKFLAAEKVLSFTPLATLTLIVVATGLIKSAHYLVYLPTDLLRATTVVHDLTIWLTLVVVGMHVAAIFLVPRNWPGLRAMITGRMRREIVAEEFAAWDDELRGQETAPPAAEVIPATRPAER